MAGTYLLIQLPEPENYMNEMGRLFTYLPITTCFEEEIRVVSELVKENKLISAVIKGKDTLSLFEIGDDNYPERINPYEAVITVSKNHFTLTVTYDKYAEPITTDEIRISELKQARENTGKFKMAFTSEWSDGSIIESVCRVDALSGCVDADQSEVMPDDSADLLRSYVSDEDGNKCEVFAFENNGFTVDWLVNPLDFINLQDAQSESDDDSMDMA